MTDHDLRQIELMKRSIYDFEVKRIPLNRLVAMLDGLETNLCDQNSAWRAELRKKWGVLEDVNAVRLDTGRGEQNVDYSDIIESALSAIKALLAQVTND